MNPFERGIPVERPPHDEARAEVVHAEVIAEWPVGTFVENLLVLDDENALVSVLSSAAIEKVSLGTGKRETFARLSKEPTGITGVGDRIFVNVGSPGERGWAIYELKMDGGFSVAVEIENALFLNGNAPFTESSLLTVDSILGQVFEVDVDTGRVSLWLESELLTKSSPEPMMPGANGVKAVGDQAYFTSTERALVLRCDIVDGKPGALEVLAKRFVGDDFAVDTEGNLYVTTHVHNQVLRLSPTGERVVVAGVDEWMHGATSCAFDSHGGLLVTTTGGIFAPIDGQVRGAKLVRLEIDALPARLGHPRQPLQERVRKGESR